MADNVSQQVESLLSRLFAAADQRGPDAAARFAGCFAEDGQFLAGGQVLDGRKEIEASRENSWNGVDSRAHTVRGLYRSTQTAQQFVLLGSLEVHLADNKGTLSMRFCSKLDVQQKSDALEIVRYEAFAEAPSSSK